MNTKARIRRLHDEKAQSIIELLLKSLGQLVILPLEFWKIFDDHWKTIV